MPKLTTREAAARLGVTPRAVLALIKRGRLKAEMFGEQWAVDADSVRDFKPMKAGRKKNPATPEY